MFIQNYIHNTINNNIKKKLISLSIVLIKKVYISKNRYDYDNVDAILNNLKFEWILLISFRFINIQNPIVIRKMDIGGKNYVKEGSGS